MISLICATYKAKQTNERTTAEIRQKQTHKHRERTWWQPEGRRLGVVSRAVNYFGDEEAQTSSDELNGDEKYSVENIVNNIIITLYSDR